ncbi:hypothetical protein [Hespellia stercorisuis]|uniref:Uncharacterized protein n=1 Tax=Hespellia stercorisuis DSM 15480 TaxID=1121950 RepID=A0A1M6SHB6_9FIRM|nr:hypothetical protein [Hespellia stercorisuis]SHK44036.1 hypothetical protein SAMN02745243_02951 [Hespellia stercorisuis DSM 15480]
MLYQRSSYERSLIFNPEYEFIGIFADRGISGFSRNMAVQFFFGYELFRDGGETMTWVPYNNGNTIGTKGSENGTILSDEEFGGSVRITVEECPSYSAITCGVYGAMVHTAFFDKKDSEEKYKSMKRELEEFILLDTTDEEECAFYDAFTSKY